MNKKHCSQQTSRHDKPRTLSDAPGPRWREHAGAWVRHLASTSGDAVKLAVTKGGFRHIDCAHLYGNEAEVGDAIKSVISDGVVKRNDLFITSKLWNTNHHPDHVEEACRNSIADLKCEYLDLYLIHWPVSFVHPEKHAKEEDFFPANEQGGMKLNPVPLGATWNAMESLVEKGLVKAIGISNFKPHEIKEVFDATKKVKPAVHQIEVQPAIPQHAIRKINAELGMLTTAYCPLGIGMGAHAKGLLQNETLQAIAKKYDVAGGSAQLMLRWNVQMGNIVLTKSVTPERIVENASTPLNGLSEEAMAEMEKFYLSNAPMRICNPPNCNLHGAIASPFSAEDDEKEQAEVAKRAK